MDPRQLEKLKRKLPKGFARVIASRCNLSANAVRHVLNGRYNNDRVIHEAIKLARQEKERQAEIIEAIHRL